MHNGHPNHCHLTNGHGTSAPSLPNGGTKLPHKAKKTVTLSSQNNGNSNYSSNRRDEVDDNDDGSDDMDTRSSSSSEEDVATACRILQRQRSSSNAYQNGPYDYRLFAHRAQGHSVRKRKLILHVDIRNTILVADSITNVSVEEALNSFLTAVVWGQDVDGVWEWYSDIPSLKSPAPGLKTYYKYLERKMVSNQDDRAKLRLTTGDFVHAGRGQQFLKHFNVHLARLAWQYPNKSMNKVLTMSGKDGKPYHYILPAFYNLLQHLTHRKRDFAIVLRTYGRDAENVLSSLAYGIQGNHPAFRTPLHVPVHKKPGILRRSKGDGFVLRTFKPNNHSETLDMLTYDRDIYRHFCSSKGISGYVDDFWEWQNNDYCHMSGKPLWIDPTDTRHHHIFFDDNFRSDDEDSIVDVRLFSKENPCSAQSMSLGEVQRFENACLVQADLLESIADESYFIKMVKMCEDNYSRLMSDDQL